MTLVLVSPQQLRAWADARIITIGEYVAELRRRAGLVKP